MSATIPESTSRAAWEQIIKDRVAAERERCAKIVRERAAVWNGHAKTKHPGRAESLADECEDILAEILKE